LSGRFRRPCTIGVHGLFCHYDPVANTPVFLGLTADDSPQTRRAVARKALILSFIIILVFCAAGKLIFDLFGITLPAFRITGGLLVLLVGFHMLQGDHFSVQHPSEEDKQQSKDAQLEVAISPLALPILAGPGTIATAMNYASAGGVSEFGITIITAFLLLCLITYVFFVSGERFVSYIGVNGIKVITRIMGLILAVIGTQMVIAGVDGAVKLAQAA
jgi:multiple antibiotic resistance protein